jgi:hypothetical protein
MEATTVPWLCAVRLFAHFLGKCLGKILLGAYEENQSELIRARTCIPNLLALRFGDFRVCGERARPESHNGA